MSFAPLTDPLVYATAIPAILMAGMSKGGLGGGAGALSIPLMALALSPLDAAAILLPLLCLMDLQGLWAYRRDWDRRLMKVLLPAGCLGVVIGGLAAGRLSVAMIEIIIGGIAVVFTLNYWFGRAPPAAAAAPHTLKGWFWSTVGGFTSYLAHAGGPPLQVYLLPLRLDKTVFVATTVVYFAVINFAKIAPYVATGQLNLGNIATSVVLMPFAPMGMWLGLKLHKRISPVLFYRVIYTLTFVAGLKLLWDGLTR